MSRQTPKTLPRKERRAFWRTTVLWSGHLRAAGDSAECVILDVSANGAKIRFTEATGVSEESCALEVARLGVFSCEIAWRRGNRVGLCFKEGLSTIATQMNEALPQARAIG